MNHSITAQHAKALDLHNRIMVSAQLVQTNLWDMCNGLKEMRDGKLYKELGYQNFEEYCGTEFNMSARNARKYISIIENIKPENRSTLTDFGMGKLYLLSTLSEADQQRITAENDVGDMTVKELEKEIKYLKDKNNEMDRQLDEQGDLLAEMRVKTADAKREKDDALHEVDRLNRRIGELESRPIEVAVAEPSDDVRQLKETIKNLERISEKQVDQLQEEHLRDIRELHEKNAKELGEALSKQRSEYEAQIEDLERQIKSGSDTNVVRSLFDNIRKDAMNRFESLALYAYNHTRDIATLRDEAYGFIEEEQTFLNDLYGGRE